MGIHIVIWGQVMGIHTAIRGKRWESILRYMVKRWESTLRLGSEMGIHIPIWGQGKALHIRKNVLTTQNNETHKSSSETELTAVFLWEKCPNPSKLKRTEGTQG